MAGGGAQLCRQRPPARRPFENLWVQPAAGACGLWGGSLCLASASGEPRECKAIDRQQGSMLGPDTMASASTLLTPPTPTTMSSLSKATWCTMSSLSAEKVVGWFQRGHGVRPAPWVAQHSGRSRSPRMQRAERKSSFARASARLPRPYSAIISSNGSTCRRVARVHTLLVADLRAEHRIPLAGGQTDAGGRPDLCKRVAVARSTVPAITHVDFSRRVQTVDAARQPRFHALLEAFYAQTDAPCW